VTDYPTAHVIDTQPNPTHPHAVLIRVRCPYCGKTHTHGSPEPAGRDYGHRVSHCTSDSPGYIIVDDRQEAGQ